MIKIYNPLRIYITHLAKGIMTESTFKTSFPTWTNNRIGSTNGSRTVGTFLAGGGKEVTMTFLVFRGHICQLICPSPAQRYRSGAPRLFEPGSVFSKVNFRVHASGALAASARLQKLD